MFELLKKIGVPGTVAAVVASLVTMVPFLFQVDERYAKADDIEKVVKKLETHIEAQNREIAQLAGFQQAMVTFIQEGRLPRQPVAVAPTPVPEPARVAAASPAPAPAPEESRVTAVEPAPAPVAVKPAARPVAKPPAPMMAGDSIRTEVPIKASGAASAPIEQPRNWRELSEGLVRQQSRLIKD